MAQGIPDEDLQLLNAFAITLYYDFMQAFCSIAFFGAYLVVALMAFYALLTKLSLRSATTWILLLSLLGTFFITILAVGLFAILSFTLMRMVLIHDHSIVNFVDRIEMFRAMTWVNRAQRMVHVLMGGADCNLVFIVNDSVAVWRALALCQTRTKQRLGGFLHFLIFSNLVLYLASISIAYVNPDTAVVDNWATMVILQFSGSVLGTLANVIATLLFGHMALSVFAALINFKLFANLLNYSTYKGYLEKRGSRLRARKGLVLFTESGLLYAVLQVVKLVTAMAPDASTPLDSPLIVANVVWQIGGFVLGAMYTPIVILIVAYKRSIYHSVHFNRQCIDRGLDGTKVPSEIPPFSDEDEITALARHGAEGAEELGFQGFEKGRDASRTKSR